jgi:histone acetyltransferase MYST1
VHDAFEIYPRCVFSNDSTVVLNFFLFLFIIDSIFTTERVFETTHREDGGADTHVRVDCTLTDIARATNLRIEDAAFALNECGLLMRRKACISDDEVIVITRSLVEQVAKERKVKIMYMDLSCVRSTSVD